MSKHNTPGVRGPSPFARKVTDDDQDGQAAPSANGHTKPSANGHASPSSNGAGDGLPDFLSEWLFITDDPAITRRLSKCGKYGLNVDTWHSGKPASKPDLKGKSVIVVSPTGKGRRRALKMMKACRDAGASVVNELVLHGLGEDVFPDFATWSEKFDLPGHLAIYQPWVPEKRIVADDDDDDDATPEPVKGPVDSPIVTGKGLWVPCLHNSLLWLKQQGYVDKIRYDTFKQAVQVSGVPLTEEFSIELTAQIEDSTRSAWADKHIWNACIKIAHDNSYSSLTHWLDSLRWDGVERVADFFRTAYGCEPTKDNSPLSDYGKACADVFFISAVARAFQPGCQADVMVVLIGDQGLGKTMGMAGLCPDSSWYCDDLGCDLGDRKAGEGLRSKWLVEFSEFSRINRSTIDVAKAFISRRSDYYRPAYARTHRDFPRTCVFIGTTNDDHPLHDRQNRRFMPIRCVKADVAWIAVHRDQLWAEAVHRYRAGVKWWVADPTLLAQVTEQQETARQDDYWEMVLEGCFRDRQVVTMQMVVEALRLEISRIDKSMQTRIGLALKKIGFTRTRRRIEGEQVYQWVKGEADPESTLSPP